MEPLLRGYGNTLGTVIRRTLLSSVTSVAPFAIKINNVEHEFQTISGIKEDAITLIANIRKIRFTYDPDMFIFDDIIKVSFRSTHDGEVLASEIECVPGMEIVNKDQYIATLAKDGALEFDLFLRSGRGFVDFEENKNLISELGPELESKIKRGQFIAMDSDFSPIKKVGFSYEDLNSSSKTIEERLKIQIETDGTLEAKDAMEQVARIIVAHFQIIGNVNLLEATELFEEIKDKSNKIPKASIAIEKLNLTIRSLNALKRAGYHTVEEIVKLTDEELSNIKNLGKKSVQDIIDRRNEWLSNNDYAHDDYKDDLDTNADEGENE
ncbi:DNA-directed RNA polymerase subunit alpha [Mycoplasma struthionis]|uniref:DNA-directed RNA polymerase subunit alpha n=1 Tax=Mycoplasma struthionis TaxID=538220 RepID=UPI0021BD3A07|nr:DNA-directed RNA polymerase subunit alpha [Mycoplasma struthionis]